MPASERDAAVIRAANALSKHCERLEHEAERRANRADLLTFAAFTAALVGYEVWSTYSTVRPHWADSILASQQLPTVAAEVAVITAGWALLTRLTTATDLILAVVALTTPSAVLFGAWYATVMVWIHPLAGVSDLLGSCAAIVAWGLVIGSSALSLVEDEGTYLDLGRSWYVGLMRRIVDSELGIRRALAWIQAGLGAFFALGPVLTLGRINISSAVMRWQVDIPFVVLSIVMLALGFIALGIAERTALRRRGALQTRATQRPTGR